MRRDAIFLTRRIDYFRPRRPSHANERKSETPDNEAHPCDLPPHGSPKTPFSPLYGKNQSHFSVEKCPWNEISMGWIGRSMGWKSKSMGWIDERPPSRRLSNAKRRTNTRVRFNGLPYSAHGSGAFSQAFAGASNRKGGSLRRGGIPAARKRSGRQPRHDIFSSRWAVRDVRDAMNRVSTQRASSLAATFHRSRGNPPRRDAIHRVSPARGVSPASAFLPRGGPCGTWRAVCRVIAW